MRNSGKFFCAPRAQTEMVPYAYGGGGGGMHIGYVPRERPPFLALNSVPEHISFSQITKKIRSGASPCYIFWRILQSSTERNI